MIGVRRMGGIEVGAHETVRAGCRMDVDRDSLTKAQFAVLLLRRIGCGKAAQQQAEALEHGVDLAVVAIGVGHVGKVAFVPDSAHDVLVIGRGHAQDRVMCNDM